MKETIWFDGNRYDIYKHELLTDEYGEIKICAFCVTGPDNSQVKGRFEVVFYRKNVESVPDDELLNYSICKLQTYDAENEAEKVEGMRNTVRVHMAYDEDNCLCLN